MHILFIYYLWIHTHIGDALFLSIYTDHTYTNTKGQYTCTHYFHKHKHTRLYTHTHVCVYTHTYPERLSYRQMWRRLQHSHQGVSIRTTSQQLCLIHPLSQIQKKKGKKTNWSPSQLPASSVCVCERDCVCVCVLRVCVCCVCVCVCVCCVCVCGSDSSTPYLKFWKVGAV